MLDWIKDEYADDEEDIMEVLNGAIGLDNRRPIGDKGAAFEAAYTAAYGNTLNSYAMYAYDAVYMFAYTIESMIERGEDFNNGKDITDSLRSVDFTGASGGVKILEGTNDRSAIGYMVVNMQNDVPVYVADYDPLDPNIFQWQEGVDLEWGDGASDPAEDEWSGEGYPFDCPFAQHMVTIDIVGLVTVIGLGVGLFLITLGLSVLSYRKWKQVGIQPINEPVVRSWKDSMVQVQIFMEFFQFVAIAPVFKSLEVVVRVLANLFLVDVIKMADSDKSGYWNLLITVAALVYVWFFLVLLIIGNADKCLSKVPFVQRMFAFMHSTFLPFIGNLMFLPTTTLLVDPFVCVYIA